VPDSQIWSKVEELKAEEQHRIEEEQLEQERQDAEWWAINDDLLDPSIFPQPHHIDRADPVGEWHAAEERDAVAALKKHNDKRPLAALLDPRHLSNAYYPDRPIWMSLSEETRLLIAEVILGEFKHEGGRPKKGKEKNRNTPSAMLRQATHQAVESLPFLRKALRAAYPDLRRKEIGRRAVYMASRKYGVSEDTIENYRNRPLRLRIHLN
jgi:hypothetical protein